LAGAFQTSREIFENPIWKNIVEFRLFFLIYGNAVFSEEGYRVSDDLILQRGEWLRSTRKLQDDLTYIENRQVKTYSTSVLHRAIVSLVKAQRICTRKHELGTVFTVVNYDVYQGFIGYKKENLERNLEQHQNSVGTVLEQSGNNNKNVNKDKKDKKDKENIYPSEFELFWEAYPRKVEKARALKAWKALMNKKVVPDDLISCAMNYDAYCTYNQTEQRFIKHPATFLNNSYEEYKTPFLIHSKGGQAGEVNKRSVRPGEGTQIGRVGEGPLSRRAMEQIERERHIDHGIDESALPF
jgi:hypothetical protein